MSGSETSDTDLERAKWIVLQANQEGRWHLSGSDVAALDCLVRRQQELEEALRWADHFLACLDDEGARAVRRVIAAAGEEGGR